MTEQSADCINVPNATPAAFESLVDYLITDTVKIDATSGHAFLVMQLARKYQVKRLEMMCLQSIESSLGPDNVTQLLGGAHETQNDRLLSQCRQYIVTHGADVKENGGLDEVDSIGLVKGLLSDSIDRCAHLEQQWSLSEQRVALSEEECKELRLASHDASWPSEVGDVLDVQQEQVRAFSVYACVVIKDGYSRPRLHILCLFSRCLRSYHYTKHS